MNGSPARGVRSANDECDPRKEPRRPSIDPFGASKPLPSSRAIVPGCAQLPSITARPPRIRPARAQLRPHSGDSQPVFGASEALSTRSSFGTVVASPTESGARTELSVQDPECVDGSVVPRAPAEAVRIGPIVLETTHSSRSAPWGHLRKRPVDALALQTINPNRPRRAKPAQRIRKRWRSPRNGYEGQARIHLA